MSKVTATLASSHGSLTFDTATGSVKQCSLEKSFGPRPMRIDVDEWQARYPGESIVGEHDILDFGYWLRSGKYEAPCEDWRLEREERIRQEKAEGGL